MSTVIGYIRKHWVLLSVTALVAIVSLLTKTSILLLVLATMILAILPPISTGVFKYILARATLAVTIIAGLIQIEAVLFWLTKLWVSPATYAIVTLGIVIVAVTIFGNGRVERQNNLKKTILFELALITPALLLVSLYSFRVFYASKTADNAIVRSLNYGMDDATHANMLADIMHNNGNLLYGTDRKQLLSRGTTSTYPMGWHVVSGVTINSIYDTKNNTQLQNVRLYFIAKLASLAYAITATTVLVLAVIARLRKTSALTTAFIATVATSWTSWLIIVPLFFEGFFNFLPILGYTALFVAIALDARPRPIRTLIMGMLAASSATTWVLTGPILAAALFWDFLSVNKKLSTKNWHYYAALVLSAFSFMFQALVILTNGKGMVTQLVTTGGIVSPTHLLLAIALVVFCLSLIGVIGKEMREITTPMVGLVVSFFVALAVVFVYIILKSDEITYYYYKIQSVLLLILVPLTVALVDRALSLVESKIDYAIHRTALVAVFFPAILALSIPSIVGYPYVRGTINRFLHPDMSIADAEIITNTVLDKRESADNERVFFFIPNQPPRNILGSNTTRLAYYSTACDYEIFSAVYKYDVKGLNTQLENCVSKLPLVKIYTSQEGNAELSKNLASDLVTKHEVEISVLQE